MNSNAKIATGTVGGAVGLYLVTYFMVRCFSKPKTKAEIMNRTTTPLTAPHRGVDSLSREQKRGTSDVAITVHNGSATDIVGVDVLVNSCYRYPAFWGTGIDQVIRKMSGWRHFVWNTFTWGTDCKVHVAPGFGTYARYIFDIHTTTDLDRVEEMYRNALNRAHEMGLETIVFPCMGNGDFGMDVRKSVLHVFKAVDQFVENNPHTTIKHIVFATFTDAETRAYTTTARSTAEGILTAIQQRQQRIRALPV